MTKGESATYTMTTKIPTFAHDLSPRQNNLTRSYDSQRTTTYFCMPKLVNLSLSKNDITLGFHTKFHRQTDVRMYNCDR